MFGGSVKALGNGKVGGYLVTFSDETTPDLTGDFFTKDTDFDVEDGDRRSAYYAHGLDKHMGVKKLGTLTVKTDEVGVWVEAQLNLRDDYEKAILDMAAKGKLGWSSGAPSHLVTRKSIEVKDGVKVHEILTWPIAEGSLTPTPAEPRCQAIALKSLSPLIGLEPTAEDHTTKALPSGMSYDDLRSFLQDELNEDIGDADDPYGPGLWICDVYDDVVVYRDDEDLFRISYTVTPGNDAVWGTPESVVRTTVYQPATDADAGEDMAMMKTAIAPAAMPFSEHLDTALATVKGVIDRGFDINDLRIKSGRVLSAANRSKLKDMHTQMQTAHAAMASHIGKMGDLLAATDPDAKKDVEDFAALRTRFVRTQSELLHLTG